MGCCQQPSTGRLIKELLGLLRYESHKLHLSPIPCHLSNTSIFYTPELHPLPSAQNTLLFFPLKMVYLPIQLGDHPVEFVAAPNPPTADDLARQLNFIETFVGLNFCLDHPVDSTPLAEALTAFFCEPFAGLCNSEPRRLGRHGQSRCQRSLGTSRAAHGHNEPPISQHTRGRGHHARGYCPDTPSSRSDGRSNPAPRDGHPWPPPSLWPGDTAAPSRVPAPGPAKPSSSATPSRSRRRPTQLKPSEDIESCSLARAHT